ncbi:hypothetical protein Goklo_026362 [Gossypium klotzschianum]|uniref:Uncharacterized protein n=1 Tax=Gossypium klotzschianum TaxID=34286 RepID=A0A7J8TUM2_9ROSI|nr:hypothetical protein [Gossypium klotzschianum]
MTFKKKLMKLTRMTNTLAEKQIRKKNEVSCVPWFSHLDILKRIDLFALAIYGLIIFPKVLGHIEVAKMSSELDMARHEFEREKAKLLRDISSL